MDALLDAVGVSFAKVYMAYGIVVLILGSLFFVHVFALALVGYSTLVRARGDRAWPWLPVRVRSAARLIAELVYGFANPLIYLGVLTSSPMLTPQDGWARALIAVGWTLFAVVWGVRLLGGSLGRFLDGEAMWARRGVRVLLTTALGCLALFALKDLILALGSVRGVRDPSWAFHLAVRFPPLYLIPALLLIDYLRATTSATAGATIGTTRQPHRPHEEYGHGEHAYPQRGRQRHGRQQDEPLGEARDLWRAFFLMPTRTARVAIAAAIGCALLTLGLAAHRRSDASVRQIVLAHRDAIQRAAAHYEVDPRLIAAIVYVTHRDQLSPFRGAVERLAMSAWVQDRTSEIALDRPLDLSVGLAQIKPRTAQTAGLLSQGLSVERLSPEHLYWYRGTDRVGGAWPQPLPADRRARLVAPFPVPAPKDAVVDTLLRDEGNLATCGLILALYQAQWETANPAWSLRARPEILATLYQIGFARSTPHDAPRSNAFGRRVLEVHGQPWLAHLFAERPSGSPEPQAQAMNQRSSRTPIP